MTYFDERAKEWDADSSRVERALAVASSIRSTLPLKPRMSALEYGCGTGLLSFALQSDFASITLADNSRGMLEVLAEKIKNSGISNMHPLLLDLVSDPLPATRFDLTYSLMTLHHIPDTETYLGHFYTLLKPGGFLCVADLEKEDGSFHGLAVTDVHKGFDQIKLQAQVEAAGFGGVRFSQVFVIKKNIDGREKDFPLFLMVAKKPN